MDDPTFDAPPGAVPLIVVDGAASHPGAVVLLADDADGVAAEISHRLVREPQHGGRLRRPSARLSEVTVRRGGG